MRTGISLIRLQITRIWKPIGWLFLTVLAALSVPVVAKLGWNIAAEELMRDEISLLNAPLYTGLLSKIGVLLWCSSAAVCFFCGAIVRHASRELYMYWTSAGALTATLLLDDFFLLHDAVYPSYLGLRETVVYALYGTALLVYLMRFRKTVLRTDFLLLLMALGFFAASLSVDALDGIMEIRGFYILEDGLKLFGIVSWFLYFTRTAHGHLVPYLYRTTEAKPRHRRRRRRGLAEVGRQGQERPARRTPIADRSVLPIRLRTIKART